MKATKVVKIEVRDYGSRFTMAEFAALTACLAVSGATEEHLESLTLLVNANATTEREYVFHSDLANIRDVVAMLATELERCSRLTSELTGGK